MNLKNWTSVLLLWRVAGEAGLSGVTVVPVLWFVRLKYIPSSSVLQVFVWGLLGLKFGVLFFLVANIYIKKKTSPWYKVHLNLLPQKSNQALVFHPPIKTAFFKARHGSDFCVCELEFEAWRTQQGVQRCCWQSARSLGKKWTWTRITARKRSQRDRNGWQKLSQVTFPACCAPGPEFHF